MTRRRKGKGKEERRRKGLKWNKRGWQQIKNKEKGRERMKENKESEKGEWMRYRERPRNKKVRGMEERKGGNIGEKREVRWKGEMKRET